MLPVWRCHSENHCSRKMHLEGTQGQSCQFRNLQVGGSDKKTGPGERTKLLEKKGAYTNISLKENGQEFRLSGCETGHKERKSHLFNMIDKKHGNPVIGD